MFRQFSSVATIWNDCFCTRREPASKIGCFTIMNICHSNHTGYKKPFLSTTTCRFISFSFLLPSTPFRDLLLPQRAVWLSTILKKVPALYPLLP